VHHGEILNCVFLSVLSLFLLGVSANNMRLRRVVWFSLLLGEFLSGHAGSGIPSDSTSSWKE
jgi:hypothetical protein